MTKARRARTWVLAAFAALAVSSLGGCAVRGAYGCGPFLFEVGWNAISHRGHAGGYYGGGACR